MPRLLWLFPRSTRGSKGLYFTSQDWPWYSLIKECGADSPSLANSSPNHHTEEQSKNKKGLKTAGAQQESKCHSRWGEERYETRRRLNSGLWASNGHSICHVTHWRWLDRYRKDTQSHESKCIKAKAFAAKTAR